MNETTINLTNLSIQEINYVLAGLQELPAKLANPLSQKIREQAESQLPATQPTASADTE